MKKNKYLKSFLKKIFVWSVLFVFNVMYIVPPAAAQGVSFLPSPGAMVTLSPAFMPAVISGITIHPDNGLRFDFIMDKGDTSLEGTNLKNEYEKMIKYFLAALTVPEENLWVNLSPYEKNRIISEDFGTTEMGRDLLGQDYLLKQITSSLIYPEDVLGKKFWDKVYKKAYDLFGLTEVPVDTFNKVWIVPDVATIFEKDNTALIIDSRLKVMLEDDYVALQHNSLSDQMKTSTLSLSDADKLSKLSSDVMREIIIPAIEKEVNEGKNFAQLRQIYSAMIMATWYKKALKESLLGKVYVDKNKTAGVQVDDKKINQKIFNQYVEAFRKGVYNYIKEDYDPKTKSVVPKKYFSGGFDSAMLGEKVQTVVNVEQAGQILKNKFRGQGINGYVKTKDKVPTKFQEIALGDNRPEYIPSRPVEVERQAVLEKVALKAVYKDIRESIRSGEVKYAPIQRQHLKSLQGLVTRSFQAGAINKETARWLRTAIYIHDIGYTPDMKTPENKKLFIDALVKIAEVQGVGKNKTERRELANKCYDFITQERPNSYLYEKVLAHGVMSVAIGAKMFQKTGFNKDVAFANALLVGSHHFGNPIDWVAQNFASVPEEYQTILLITGRTPDGKLGNPGQMRANAADYYAGITGTKKVDARILADDLYRFDRATSGNGSDFVLDKKTADLKTIKVGEDVKQKSLVAGLNIRAPEQMTYSNIVETSITNIAREAGQPNAPEIHSAMLDGLSASEQEQFNSATYLMAQSLDPIAVESKARDEASLHYMRAHLEGKGFSDRLVDFSNPNRDVLNDNIKFLKQTYLSMPESDANKTVVRHILGNQIFLSRDSNVQNTLQRMREEVLKAQGLKSSQGDAAMSAKPDNVGGIDLNSANLKMQIKRDGNGVVLPLKMQDVENINIEGFVPVIIDIIPMTTLPMLTEALKESQNIT